MQILNVYKSRNDNGQQFGWELCYCDFGCVSVLICSPWAVCPNWFKIPSSDEIPNSLLLGFVCLSSAILLHTHIPFFCFYATDSNTVIVLGDFYSKAEGYGGFLFSAQDATGASMQNDQQRSTTKKMLSCLSIVSLLWQRKVALHVFISITEVSAVLPLWHDLVGVWKIAVYVLHLERVGIADLVVRSAIVGAFDHNDITSWTPQINRVTLARQLSPH